MPIGARQPGVGVGPNVGPRGVDPNLPGFGPAIGAPPPSGELIVRHDSQLVVGFVPGAATTVDLIWKPTDGVGYLIKVDRILVFSDSTQPPVPGADFYLGSGVGQPEALVEFTLSADRDVADENPPLEFPATTQIAARFYNVVAGAKCVVRYQYRVALL